jgi:hypothetical protein
MKRTITSTALLMVLGATLVLSLAATAQAEQGKCSAARAAGNYGASDSGTVIGVGPRAAVAQLSLDASGNIKGNVTSSLNGAVAASTLSGTYSVNSDCTGTTTFSEFDSSGNLLLTATVSLMWDDNMRQFRFLFTSAILPDGTSLSTVVNGEARKTVP